MSLEISIVLLSIATALSCAVPGIFLVLKRQSMIIDAISHSVLLGIVIGALISTSINTPLVIILAALSGILVVVITKFIEWIDIINKDAVQGILFPLFFAIGVLIISLKLKGVHIDQTTVLAGNLNLQAMKSEHILINGIDIGSKHMWILLLMLCISTLYIFIFYNVLKISTFDNTFAKCIGLPVKFVDFGLMLITSITVVIAFNTVGSILVVSFMICPISSALLFAKRMNQVFVLTTLISVIVAVIGFYIAYIGDLATASTISLVNGIIFFILILLRKAIFYISRNKLKN